MSRPLVLTWCSEEKPGFCCGPGVAVFAHSFAANVDAELVVFTDNMPAEARQWLGELGGRVVDVPRHRGVYRTRHRRFAEYLTQFRDDRPVIACDCKDVVFQRDPFAHPDYPRVLGLVAEGKPIGACAWNRQQVHAVAERATKDARRDTYADRPVLCAGTILGRLSAMRSLCGWLWAANSLAPQATDQGVLNWVYHTALAGDPDIEVLDPHRSTLVGTADWAAADRGRFAMWHQWNRSQQAGDVRKRWV